MASPHPKPSSAGSGSPPRRRKYPVALVVGASGYVGGHLTCALVDAGVRVVATALTRPRQLPKGRLIVRRELDASRSSAVRALVDDVGPDVIINCATTNDPALLGTAVVDSARNLAQASSRAGALCVLLSTDNVFDGSRGWYAEEDPVCPVNYYGRAKVAAEETVLRLARAPLVIRTSLVTSLEPLDPRSEWVVRALEQGAEIRLFTDEFRCPVWLDELLAALIELMRGSYRGVLHVAGPERLSRYEVGAAVAMARGLSMTTALPALASRSGQERTLDGSLVISRARQILKTPLSGLRTRIRESLEAERA